MSKQVSLRRNVLILRMLNDSRFSEDPRLKRMWLLTAGSGECIVAFECCMRGLLTASRRRRCQQGNEQRTAMTLVSVHQLLKTHTNIIDYQFQNYKISLVNEGEHIKIN